MAKKSGGDKVVHRDSQSGKFVDHKEVRRHPSTTQTEHIKSKDKPGMPPPITKQKDK